MSSGGPGMLSPYVPLGPQDLAVGPSGMPSSYFPPPTGGGMDPLMPEASFAGYQVHTDQGRQHVHNRVMVDLSTKQNGEDPLQRLSACLPLFSINTQNKLNTVTEDMTMERCYSICAINRFLRSEEGRRLTRNARNAYDKTNNGPLSFVRFLGIQQSTVTESTHPYQQLADINTFAARRAMCTHLWCPDSSLMSERNRIKQATGEEPDEDWDQVHVMSGTQLYLLCVARVYHDPAAAARGGAGGVATNRRNKRTWSQLQSLGGDHVIPNLDVPNVDEGKLATQDGQNVYWRIEPYVSFTNSGPPVSRYSRGVYTGGVIPVGSVINLYRDHVQFPSQMDKIVKACYSGWLKNHEAHGLLGMMPQLELELGHQGFLF